VRFYIGITDNEWYRRLAALRPDEVNFWVPGGANFRVLDPGAPFLFKLHSPENFIAGGGFFVRFERVPLLLAWEAFGEKNGAPDLPSLRRMIQMRRGDQEQNPEIGCIILNTPFFLQREERIPTDDIWAAGIQKGKSFRTEEPVGRRIWEQVQARLIGREMVRASEALPADETAGAIADIENRLGQEYLTRGRLGQGAFRVLVTSAYDRRCALTGERTLPVLQAAHIRPFTDRGPNRTNNGLLLRSDLHILFDRGYLTVTPEHRIEVSRRIREEFDNGRDYYPLHGRRLVILPRSPDDLPAREHLEYHNREVYLG